MKPNQIEAIHVAVRARTYGKGNVQQNAIFQEDDTGEENDYRFVTIETNAIDATLNRLSALGILEPFKQPEKVDEALEGIKLALRFATSATPYGREARHYLTFQQIDSGDNIA